jgi:hypothetical protein
VCNIKKGRRGKGKKEEKSYYFPLKVPQKKAKYKIGSTRKLGRSQMHSSKKKEIQKN